MAAADYRLMTEATGQRIAAALEALSLDVLTPSDVVNNLTSTATNKPLSAAQGKLIRDTYNTVGDNVNIENQTVASGTFKTMATFTPTVSGSYLIIANMGFSSNSTGIRILLVDVSETDANTSLNSVLATGRAYLQRVSLYTLNANQAVYIRAYQNSGSDMTVGGSYRVLKLK